jgi:hypothetical protein
MAARAVNMIQMQVTATPTAVKTWGALKARYR